MNAEIKDLIDKTFTSVTATDENIIFKGDRSYKLYHDQDCCECVIVSDIVGELSDLENSPIKMAIESTNEGETDWGPCTWTFYRFATEKGGVVICWRGESNGYYSESVQFMEIE